MYLLPTAATETAAADRFSCWLQHCTYRQNCTTPTTAPATATRSTASNFIGAHNLERAVRAPPLLVGPRKALRTAEDALEHCREVLHRPPATALRVPRHRVPLLPRDAVELPVGARGHPPEALLPDADLLGVAAPALRALSRRGAKRYPTCAASWRYGRTWPSAATPMASDSPPPAAGLPGGDGILALDPGDEVLPRYRNDRSGAALRRAPWDYLPRRQGTDTTARRQSGMSAGEDGK